MTPKQESNNKKEIEKQIDENLRRVYEQDSSNEIPDRFIDLLQKLREQE